MEAHKRGSPASLWCHAPLMHKYFLRLCGWPLLGLMSACCENECDDLRAPVEGIQHLERCRRFWKGLLAVWVGGALGQAGAFLLARYLVRDWVSDYVARKWSKARSPYPSNGHLMSS